jgi:uncharacterized protein (TIGR03437 family)
MRRPTRGQAGISLWFCALLLFAGKEMQAQSAAPPSFTEAGVVNAADYSGGAVAPGEIVAIFGTALGPAAGTDTYLAGDLKHVTRILGETRVLFEGAPAPVIYASESLVTAVVPSTVAGHDVVRLQVEHKGVLSAAVSMPVALARPAIFTSDASGHGQGAILNADYSFNGPARPAAKGSIIVVYATSGGPTSPPIPDDMLVEGAAPIQLPAIATIGGVPAGVLYAGPAPSLVAGALQVNLAVPDGAPVGDAVEIRILVGGAWSQPNVTVAIAPPTGDDPLKLLSPYVPRTRVYKGQLHTHTVGSDGKQSAAEVVAAYRDAGYDFMAITDHVTVTPDPGVPGILFFLGEELVVPIPYFPWKPAFHYNRIRPGTDGAWGVAGFVFLNHPAADAADPVNPTDPHLEAMSGYCGIEANSDEDEKRVDQLLTDKGRFLILTSDDCHDVTTEGCMRSSTHVAADGLTREEIMASLRRGNFYSSRGAAIFAVSTAGRMITVSAGERATIAFVADGGREVYSAPGVFTATYTVSGNEKYVRARVTRASDNARAFTNPIYIAAGPGDTYPECVLQ